MAGAFLIMLREGVEAALIVGLVLAVLARTGRLALVRQVGWGVAAAVVASVAFAFLADGLSELFEGAGQELFNGVVLAVAAAMITYVVVWVRESRGRMQQQLAQRVEGHALARRAGVFVLVFLTVFREGFESVLFMWGVVLAAPDGAAGALAGGVAGLACAVALAWLLFAGGKRLPVRGFLNATMALLVLFAAGMLAAAAGQWIAVDWLPALASPVWNTGQILPDGSGLGGVLAILLGYNANPSLMEVLIYFGYLMGITLWLMRGRVRRPALAPN